MALEQLGYNSPEGSVAPGKHRKIIKEGVATRQLTPAESGSLCIFDTAAGVVFTLPTPVVGMTFEFASSIATTGEYKVITKTIASEFIFGSLLGYSSDVTESDGFLGNGTSHVSVNHDGTATGGATGDSYTLTAISTTLWRIEGSFYTITTAPTDPFDTT